MKVAVAVRAHKTTRKLESLLTSLSGSSHYDLYLAANETRNEVQAFGVTKLTHTADIMAPLGQHLASETHLVHASDMVFGFLHQSLPSYEFILMVEDDVHFPHDGRRFIERAIDGIRSRPGGVDLLATKIRRAERDWWWYGEGKRLFDDVRAMLFSLVGLSVAAIEHLVASRHREAATGETTTGPVFCEAFVPSTLAEAGDFSMVDVNTLLPGSYEDESFTIGLPFMLEDPAWRSRTTEMVHPVFSAAEFLERRLAHARSPGGNVRAFLTDLENRQASIAPELRTEYAARAGGLLAMDIIERLERLEARIR